MWRPSRTASARHDKTPTLWVSADLLDPDAATPLTPLWVSPLWVTEREVPSQGCASVPPPHHPGRRYIDDDDEEEEEEEEGGGESLIRDLKRKANSLSQDTKHVSALVLEGGPPPEEEDQEQQQQQE